MPGMVAPGQNRKPRPMLPSRHWMTAVVGDGSDIGMCTQCVFASIPVA